MAFGLTSTGFKRKRLADIKTELEATARATFGASINLQPNSIFSQLIGIFSERESELWELAEGVYYSQYPDTAEGVALDNIASISGVTRLDSQPSRIKDVHLFGDLGTVIPAGTVFSISGNSLSRFKTDQAVTLVAGVDEVQTLTFGNDPDSGSFKLTYRGSTTSALPFSSTAQDVQDALNELPYLSEVTVTGTVASALVITFGGVDGKIDQPLLVVTDNTMTASAVATTSSVVQTTAGVPQGLTDVTAESDGPTDAPIYTLIEIETPVTGLDAVLNIEDVILGRDEETDTELRIRRIQSLQRAGSSTVEAIRARLLEVQEVEEVVIFENTTLVTDGDGLPGKSFKAFVQGGDDQEVGDAVWANKPAGIQTVGDVEVEVVDSQGVTQTVFFSRPTEIPVYVNFEITKDTSPTSQWPTNGEDLVREAIVAFFSTLEIGQDVIVYPKLISALNDIPGIDDVRIGIDVTASPPLDTDDNIAIAVNEKAVIEDSEADIEITVIP